jgi:LysM repeat protein
MTTRNPFASTVGAAVFALALTLPLVSFADDASMSAPSTNAAPAPVPTPAPEAPAPAAPSAPAPADTTTTSAERPSTYTLVTGDSLDSVAKKFNTSIHALAKLNKIPKSMYRKLRAGKVLQIPPASTDSK